MLGTFLLGIVAGWGARHAEPKIRELLGSVLGDTPIEPKEMAVLSFALCLLAAALVAEVLFRAHAGPLAFGAVVGVFGPRVWDRWQASKAPDYDS